MLTKRIIPCLDVRHGRVVKGVRFKGLLDAGDPASLAAAYESQGADEIVVLDVAATLEGRNAMLGAVRAVRAAIGIPLTVGGGVRSTSDALALLEAGADKIGVNTSAVERPALVGEMAERFGRQCVVVAIDAEARPDGGWRVVTHAGTRPRDIEAARWAGRIAEMGAGEILLTSVDRDGTRTGYDLALLRAIRQAVGVPVIASGGANSPAHMAEAFEAGADAALAASIFHEGDLTVMRVKEALARLGVEVRL